MTAQQLLQTVQGNVSQKNAQGSLVPLAGIKIWGNKQHFTFTDKAGKFSFEMPIQIKHVIVMHPTLGNDTISIDTTGKIHQIVFPYIQTVKEVTIKQRNTRTEITLLTPIKIERIGSKELLKAACCNLSESFETTPSVDIAFTDGLSGYKQIQLLGLAGAYTLITRENIPDTRGIASVTGLSLTPGQWIEGMQLSKGTGSVVNGYEGLAGQINVEWKKPMDDERFFFNAYQSAQGRSEMNLHTTYNPTSSIHANVFMHVKSQWQKVDQNHDHYIDQPLGNAFIFANRWMAFGKKGLEIQAGIKIAGSDNWGGSVHYRADENPMLSKYWGMQQQLFRTDSWIKIGKVYTHKPWKSMGLQIAHSLHQQQFDMGRKQYRATEQQLYANYIFQSIIRNTFRPIKLGATIQYVKRDENAMNLAFNIHEFVYGIFGEYTHYFSEQWQTVVGYRIDYHQLYGLYTTPRMHIRYAPSEKISIRGSAGKAYRTAGIFAENIGLFASNRELHIRSSNPHGVYGMGNEKAYNMGVNGTYAFGKFRKKGSISVDYYYTHFMQQVIANWENPRQIIFETSTAPSFAHSMQAQIDYSPIRKMDIRLAYRFNEVMMTIDNQLLQKPLQAKHRAFINWAYTLRSKWSFDYTLQWVGSKRIPSTASNPDHLQFKTQSPSFITMNVHVNKKLRKWDLYGGIENILNYMQHETIIDANNPFGSYFDASLIWGPMNGRNIYLGCRFNILK